METTQRATFRADAGDPARLAEVHRVVAGDGDQE